MRAYPETTPDYRPHGLLGGIPYPIGCTSPDQQTGGIAIWKRFIGGGTSGDHEMTWVEKDGVAENTGVADCYQVYWRGKGHVYNHPSLDPATGLVERLWKAAVDDSRVFEVSKIVSHFPPTVVAQYDPRLREYTVQWKNYEDAYSTVSVADCVDCPLVVAAYWNPPTV